MDVDSAMMTETDHDPAAQNHSTGPAEQPQSGGGSPVAAPPQQQPVQQTPVVGPRPAPTYSVVNAITEKKEDGPGPRCGHTLTAVAAVGEEGTPGYIGPRLILFGGATALEGNSAASGAPSSAGSAGISKYRLLLIAASAIFFILLVCPSQNANSIPIQTTKGLILL